MAALFVNFAYGSNMSSRRLRARTPSARAIGSALLAGHRLAWHKVGRDGSAKCDIVETGRAEDHVWGVLFEIAEAERCLLDMAEGLGHGYEFKLVSVRDGTLDRIAGAYHATDIDPTLMPFDWYLALVLDGAREHGLPQAHVDAIAAVAAAVDPDPLRRASNLALLR